jgi:hypothetical protein
VESRNPVVAGILSAMFPGLGQFYVRRWRKGVVFSLVSLVTVGFGVAGGAFQSLKDCSDVGCLGWVTRLIVLIIFLPLAIWSILDAVRTAKRPEREP